MSNYITPWAEAVTAVTKRDLDDKKRTNTYIHDFLARFYVLKSYYPEAIEAKVKQKKHVAFVT